MKSLAQEIEEMETKKSNLMKSTFTAAEKKHWRSVILNSVKKGVVKIEMESMDDGVMFRCDKLNRNRMGAFEEWLMENDLYYFENCWSIVIYTFHALVVKSCRESINISYNTVTHEVQYGCWGDEENWECI